MKKGIIVLVTVTMLAMAAGAVYFYQLQEHSNNDQKIAGQNGEKADEQSGNNTDNNVAEIINSGTGTNEDSTGIVKKDADNTEKEIADTDTTEAKDIEDSKEGTDLSASIDSNSTETGADTATTGAEDEATKIVAVTTENSDSEELSTEFIQSEMQDEAEGSTKTPADQDIVQQTEDQMSANESEDPGAYTKEDGMFEYDSESYSNAEILGQESIIESEIPANQVLAQLDDEVQPTLNQDLLDETDENILSDAYGMEEDSDILAYAPTTGMSFEELVGDNGNYSFPEGYPDADTYCLIVDEYYQVVLVYEKDDNGEFTVPVRYMLCSTGRDGRTEKGTFSMGTHRVRYGHFVNTDYYAQYWTQLTGRLYFHSILYTDRDPAAYVESAYEALGTQASAGCIRLTVPDARWIFYNVAHDSTVIVRYGSADDEETAKIREQLILAALPTQRLALIAGESPVTDNWSIEGVKIEIPFVQGVAAIYQ